MTSTPPLPHLFHPSPLVKKTDKTHVEVVGQGSPMHSLNSVLSLLTSEQKCWSTSSKISSAWPDTFLYVTFSQAKPLACFPLWPHDALHGP